MNQRIAYLDCVAGIMIVYMIFTHCCQAANVCPDSYNTLSVVFSSFMAWFFFKSGMFHRNISVKEAGRNIRNKMLRPYIAFMLIGYVAYAENLLVSGDGDWFRYILSPIKQCVRMAVFIVGLCICGSWLHWPL